MAHRAGSESAMTDEMNPGGWIDFVCDGPPGPEAGRFVELEDADGRSISLGTWTQRGNYWVLRIPDPRAEKARADAAEQALKTSRRRWAEAGEGARIRIAALEKESDERLRRIYLFEECIENDGKRIAELNESVEASRRIDALHLEEILALQKERDEQKERADENLAAFKGEMIRRAACEERIAELEKELESR